MIQRAAQPSKAVPQQHLQQGVIRLSKAFRFEAAHYLPNMPAGHKCRRMHGHSFLVELICEGVPDPHSGIVTDFGEIKEAFRPFLAQLDHYLLNEVDGLDNPTSERIAVWIWDRVKPHLPALSAVLVHETCSSKCEYRG